jgi:hypothetical protein
MLLRLAGHDLDLHASRLINTEPGDTLTEGTARTRSGDGDVDGWSCTVSFPVRSIETLTNAHSLWRYLWNHGDPDAARRLQSDPAFRPDTRRLEVTLDEKGSTGFTLTADQLSRQRAFWFPELDLFVSAGSPPVSFADHQSFLLPRQGQRVLDRVNREPEATYASFTNRWEDMGNPAFSNPHWIPPGHLVGIAWDGALHKFGVDRLAGVRNDYGKADEFLLAFDFAETQGLAQARTSQRLTDGLPVIVSTFEKDGIRCDVEQLTRPLSSTAAELPGDSPMVLLQQVRLTNTRTTSRRLAFRLLLDRGQEASVVQVGTSGNMSAYALIDAGRRSLLVVQGKALPTPVLVPTDAPALTNGPGRHHRLDLEIPLAAGGMAGIPRETAVSGDPEREHQGRQDAVGSRLPNQPQGGARPLEPSPATRCPLRGAGANGE